MSLILDALKKAEQDRHAGQAPVLDEMLVRRAPVTRRRENDSQQILLLAGAIAAVLFALAGIAYWLWPSAETAPAAASAAAPVAVAAPPAPLAAAVAPAEPALRIDPERLEAPVADVPEEPVPSGDTGAALAMTMDELDADVPQDSPTKPRRDAPPAPPPLPATETEPEPTPAAEPASPAPAAAIAATPPPSPAVAATPEPATAAVRPLKEMPPAFRSEFPRLVVDVHVYNDNPLRRFVLVNGKKYRETDTLVDGPRVVEITPEGVIVEHRGSRVLVQLPG